MGFTVPPLEENLERSLKTDRAELDRRIAAYKEEEMSIRSYYRKLKRQRKTLEHLTLRRWVNCMRTFRTREGLSPFLIPKGTTGLTALQRHMLNEDDEYEWYYFGLPVSDLRYLLRAIAVR